MDKNIPPQIADNLGGHNRQPNAQDGTLNQSGIPAEIFNLRADAYMWAFWQMEQHGQAITTYMREVAPRF